LIAQIKKQQAILASLEKKEKEIKDDIS